LKRHRKEKKNKKTTAATLDQRWQRTRNEGIQSQNIARTLGLGTTISGVRMQSSTTTNAFRVCFGTRRRTLNHAVVVVVLW